MGKEINFQDYLLRNEKWLGVGNEANGNHITDGKIDDQEASIFFSGAHIELGSNSAGDAKLTEQEFENWFSANEDAISSYFDSIGVESNESSKKSMLQSMLDFIGIHADVIATNQGESGTKLKDLDVSELQEKVKPSINFEDYLLRNEKWLGSDDEEKGKHVTDGKLDSDEISTFFSNSHIELDSDSSGDARLTKKEFENWYESNKDAISSYYESIGVEFNDESKNAMMQSMLKFIDKNSDVIATKQGENGTKLKDLDVSELKGENKTSPFISISHEETLEKFGQEYLDEAREALKQWDYNKDGSTSAEEMSKNISTTFSNVFAGNDALSELAQQISDKQGELYTKYAGEDGILDEYEYLEALNSDDNGVLLDQYWELKDTQEALQGETDLKGLQRYDLNGDGKVNPLEVYQKKVDLYSKLYESDPVKQREAKKIALDQAIMLNKYARTDGNISSEKYAEALRSESYIGKTNDYLALNGVNSKITPQTVLQLNFDSELRELYEKLAEAPDEDSRNTINAKIKELEQKHNIELKKLNIQDIIASNSDLDDEQKAELNDLYEKYSQANTPEDRAKIYAEIKQKCQEYNVTDSTFTKLSLEAIDIGFNSELGELYQKLSNATTSEERDSVNIEISQRIQMYNKDSADLRLKDMINSSDFSDDIKAELQDLYNSLSEAPDEASRDSISAQILQKFEEYQLPKEFKTSLDIEAHRSAAGAELADLYSMLSEASGEDQKNQIQAQIKSVEQNYKLEEAKLIIDDVINSFNLNTEQKAELKDLYTSLSEAESYEAKEQTYALIEEFSELYNLPEDKTTLLDIQSLTIERDNKLSELYSQLAEATGEEIRNSINQEIKLLLQTYEEQEYELNVRFADIMQSKK